MAKNIEEIMEDLMGDLTDDEISEEMSRIIDGLMEVLKTSINKHVAISAYMGLSVLNLLKNERNSFDFSK